MITPPTAPDGLWYWEDINPGDTMDLGTSTMTRDELLAFGRTYDPQPHHVDEEAAAHSMFGKLFSSGWHSCCILMRQYVDVMLNKSASLGAGGVEEVRFMKPVFIGDELMGKATCKAKRALNSKPDVGTMHMVLELWNSRGEQVLAWEAHQFMRRRHPGAPVAGERA